MKEDIIKPIVFFVLITVIAFSMVGTWRVITMDVKEGEDSTNGLMPESNTGAGYVSINIMANDEGNKENE